MHEPTGPGPDPVNIGCNVLFGLLLLIPAAALLAVLAVAVASVPLMVALFPTAITLGGLAMLVLYIRHRRRVRRAAPPPEDG
jgi:Flp pilus assembly protein TadB